MKIDFVGGTKICTFYSAILGSGGMTQQLQAALIRGTGRFSSPSDGSQTSVTPDSRDPVSSFSGLYRHHTCM